MVFSFKSKKIYFQLGRRKPFVVWHGFFAFLFFFVLRDEVQTNSATGRLLERDGSFYLKKVFHVDFFTCYSFRMTTCDHFSIITTQKTVARSFPLKGRLFTAKLITVSIVSRDKNSTKFNFSQKKNYEKE